MCNILIYVRARVIFKKKVRRIITAAWRRAAAMFGFVPSASAALLEVLHYNISLCHTPGIKHVVTPIQIVDLLNDKI